MRNIVEDDDTCTDQIRQIIVKSIGKHMRAERNARRASKCMTKATRQYAQSAHIFCRFHLSQFTNTTLNKIVETLRVYLFFSSCPLVTYACLHKCTQDHHFLASKRLPLYDIASEKKILTLKDVLNGRHARVI